MRKVKINLKFLISESNLYFKTKPARVHYFSYIKLVFLILRPSGLPYTTTTKWNLLLNPIITEASCCSGLYESASLMTKSLSWRPFSLSPQRLRANLDFPGSTQSKDYCGSMQQLCHDSPARCYSPVGHFVYLGGLASASAATFGTFSSITLKKA